MSFSKILSKDNVEKNVLHLFSIKASNIEEIKYKNTDKQRAVYKVTYGEKIYCLKKIYFSKEELLFVYSALEWLFRWGISVPRFLQSSDKKRYASWENMLFILTDWLEGEKCDYDNIDHIIKCSTNLGKMHKVTRDFFPIKDSLVREGYNNSYSSYNKHFYDLLATVNTSEKCKDKFSKLYLESFNNNYLLAKKSLETSRIINHNNLNKSLCHMDYVNKNIIINGDTVSVIDFDKCRLDYVSHDISYFLRRILKRNNSKWSLDIAISSINLYETENKLGIDDYLYILSYLSFPQKYWKISRDYFKNKDKCNKEGFYSLLMNTVEKDESALNFISAFSDYIQNKFKIKLPG